MYRTRPASSISWILLWDFPTFNPYVSAAVAVNVVAGITGTALGGLQIFANSMLESYLNLGINPAAFHRLMVIACCGLDTLPHCATFITMCTVWA